MSDYKPGTRVGAVLGATDGVVDFLGFGTYVGDEIPESAVGPFAEVMREAEIPNPKIKLDNGKIVWGCECWWGAEEAVQEFLDSQDEVNNINIDNVRVEYKEDEETE